MNTPLVSGQEWLILDHFVEDFSVTTNALGTPQIALKAARDALDFCHHYPPANQEPAKTDLSKFIWPEDYELIHSRILLGNGASELIDLVTRSAKPGPWRPGPWIVQYKEYERSASSLGRDILKYNDKTTKAALTCIVNPNNPTGDYMNIEEMKSYIEKTVPENSTVMVDESMQPWHSEKWQQDSLISQSKWIKEIFETKGIAIYIMHSWTKIWSCTGLRIGSVICPTTEHCQDLKKIQVPWSVNVCALKFLEVVTSDAESKYMKKTWEITTNWRSDFRKKILDLKPKDQDWVIEGKPFISWVWIDFKDKNVAADAVIRARAAGVPVRPGVNGYGCDTCVRAAVRSPALADVLIKSWIGLGQR
ncbi:hypothetical protein HDU92_003149 [Lobulomyces angularis]|nr:hypothetical protein HDU92_003149 [Lobulomyces angularis]